MILLISKTDISVYLCRKHFLSICIFNSKGVTLEILYREIFAKDYV